jgi:predicted permease
MGFERWLYVIRLRLRSVFRSRQADRELDDEIEFHLARQTEANLAAGLSPQEARAAAVRRFGGIQQRKEECRDQRRVNLLEHLGQDLRYAMRTLWRSRGFALTACLSLSLGIGVNVAAVGVMSQLLLAPPTAERPERLANLEPGRPQVSHPELVDLAASRRLGRIAGYSHSSRTWKVGDAGESVHALLVTGNYFDVLGASVAHGRPFSEPEAASDPQVAVLSHRFWTLRMAGIPEALTRPLWLDGRPFEVAGILPPGFRPLSGPVEVPEVYLPATDVTVHGIDDREMRLFSVLARLPEGMAHRQAQNALSVLTSQLARDDPGPDDRVAGSVRVFGVSAADLVTRHSPELWLVCGAALVLAGLILVSACANVSGLLLVRGVARRREIALRLALGASRGRLVRQLVAEALALALPASAAALAMNLSATALLNRALSNSTGVVSFSLIPDASLLFYVLGVAVAAALLTGLWPALQASSPSLAPTLRSAGVLGHGWRSLRARNALVVAQVAVCTLLLAVAALFLRSLGQAALMNPGFDVEQTLVARVSLPRERYEGQEPRFFEEAAARVNEVPGVASAAMVAMAPLSFVTTGGQVRVAEAAPEDAQSSYVNVVGPRYFETMGIPVVRGREFGDGDVEGAPGVAIVNLAFVQRHLGGDDAIGRRLMLGGPHDPAALRVVGVVGDTQYLWPGEEPPPQLYVSALSPQRLRRLRSLVARTSVPPESAAASVRRAVQALEPLAEVRVSTMRDHASWALWPSRIGASVLGALGGLGTLLATVGLAGLLSYVVQSIRPELGIRLALGARRRELVASVLARGLRLVAAGAAIGTALSLLALRPLGGFLAAGIGPADPTSLGVALGLVAIVGGAASALPAWQATRVDPARTLCCD